jgi:sugar phosphate permease
MIEPAAASGASRANGVARRYPWFIATVGMLTLFMSNGLTATGLSVFDPALLDAYGWTRGELKFRDVLTFWVAALLAPAVGVLLDRVNPKYVMMFGIGCLAAGLFGYASLPADPRVALLQVYAIHLLFALSIACAGGAVVILLVSSWFVAHRGLALGIALVGTSLGSALLPSLNAGIIGAQGWRAAFGVDALLPLGFLLLLALAVRGMPRHAGMRALGQAAQVADLKDHGLTFAQAVRTRSFYAICLSGFLTYYAIFAFLQHLVLHMTRGLGYSLGEAARAFLLFSLLAMAAKMLSGVLADRLDRHRVFLGCLALMLAGAVALATLERDWLMMAVVGIGLGWGGAFTLYNMLAVSNFGLREIGRINGVVNLCESLGTGLGSWMTGYLFDLYGSYQVAFGALAVMVCASLAIGALVRNELALAGSAGASPAGAARAAGAGPDAGAVRNAGAAATPASIPASPDPR